MKLKENRLRYPTCWTRQIKLMKQISLNEIAKDLDPKKTIGEDHPAL